MIRFINELSVGDIAEGCAEDGCMCATAYFLQSLISLVATPEIFSKMEFPSTDKQERFFARLKEKDPSLYAKLNASQRTLFLREGGK